MSSQNFGFASLRKALSRISGTRLLPAVVLAALCPLLTGCPHNDYTVQLKPQPGGVERILTFYRADDGSSNGVADPAEFSSNELARITRVYPANAVKLEGRRYVARGKFDGAMPDDVGGSGSFTNFSTSLGGAGFYVERFRGNDDLAANVARRYQAADQITDLAIGWSKSEFGHERGYKKLRQFLDRDFRNDLKNGGLYFWTGEISGLSDTNAAEEFTVRFGQYLVERGYLKLSDAPAVYAILQNGDAAAMLGLVRRVVAGKMGIPAAGPLPKSFGVLNDPAAFEKSWEGYLARSDRYRAKVREWQEKKKSDPKLASPKPLEVMDDLFANLLFGAGGETDHLTVKLALPQAPDHTNGKWRDGQVVWGADLDPDRALPVICYASWSDADKQFQTAHFGGVILNGDALAQYCVWRNTLNDNEAREWESFLSGLPSGQGLKKGLEAFRFSAAPAVEPDQGQENPLDVGRRLLLDVLPKEAGTGPENSK